MKWIWILWLGSVQLLWAQTWCTLSGSQSLYDFDSCKTELQASLEVDSVLDQTWQDHGKFELKPYAHHDYWQKYALYNSSVDTINLVWKEFLAKDTLVEFYVHRDGKVQKTCVSGTSVPMSERCLPTRYATGTLILLPGEKLQWLVRKSSNNSLHGREQIVSPESLEAKYLEGRFIGYHYLGFALGIFAVNLLMFIIIRERNFLAYILFHISLVGATLLMTGLVQDYFSHHNWGFWIPYFSICSALTLTFFTLGFFGISWRRPGWIMGVFLIWPPLQTLLYELEFPVHPFDDQSFFVLVLALTLFALGRKEDLMRQRLYLIAWGGYTVLLSAYIMNAAGLLPDWLIFRYGAYEAHAWEMVWFTVGFAKLVLRRIAKAHRLSQELEKDKAEILRRFSHELRTPLMGIMGELELKSNWPSTDAWNTVQISAHKLLSHVNQVMEYMEFKSGQVQEHRKSLNLMKEFHEIMDQLLILHGEKTYELKGNWRQFPNYWVDADPDLVRQMLRPLLDNALKFSTDQVVVIQMELIPGGIQIELINQGPRLDLNEFQHLQKEFQRSEDFLRQRYGGLGLGLGVARQSADMLGAQMHALECQSGAHIQIHWPVICSIPMTKSLPSKSFAEALVLIVDDQGLNRKVIGKMLDNIGCRWISAENGLDAYKKWRKSRPDLILMDLQMPKVDGATATHWIRKMERKRNLDACAIVAVSAHCGSAEQNSSQADGFNHIWSKPIKIVQIVDELKELGFEPQA